MDPKLETVAEPEEARASEGRKRGQDASLEEGSLPHTEEVEEARSAILGRPSRFTYHDLRNGTHDIHLRTLNLSLRDDGALLDSQTGKTAPEFVAVYVTEKGMFRANGSRIEGLDWAGAHISSERASKFLETLEEGKLSGVREGVVRSFRLYGAPGCPTAVFTKGLPPAHRPPKQSEPAAVAIPSNPDESSETVLSEKRSHSESETASSAEDGPSNLAVNPPAPSFSPADTAVSDSPNPGEETSGSKVQTQPADPFAADAVDVSVNPEHTIDAEPEEDLSSAERRPVPEPSRNGGRPTMETAPLSPTETAPENNIDLAVAEWSPGFVASTIRSERVRELVSSTFTEPETAADYYHCMFTIAENEEDRAILAPVVSGLLSDNPNESEMNAVRESVEFFKQLCESRNHEEIYGAKSEDELNTVLAGLADVRNNAEMIQQITAPDENVSEIQDSHLDSVPEMDTGPVPDLRVESEVALEPELIVSADVEVHALLSNNTVRLTTRSLELRSGGKLFENGKPASDIQPVYLHNGNAFLKDGSKVEGFDWGTGYLESSRLGKYIDSPSEGGLVGVRDGYTKSLRVDGIECVFVAGEPPVVATVESSEIGEKPSETRSKPQASEPAQQDELAEAQKYRSMSSQPSDVSIAVKQPNGGYRGERLSFRIDATGNLEFKSRSAEAWKKANETSVKIGEAETSFELIYRRGDTLYHADGSPVDSLTFAGEEIRAHTFKYNIFRSMDRPHRKLAQCLGCAQGISTMCSLENARLYLWMRLHPLNEVQTHSQFLLTLRR